MVRDRKRPVRVRDLEITFPEHIERLWTRYLVDEVEPDEQLVLSVPEFCDRVLFSNPVVEGPVLMSLDEPFPVELFPISSKSTLADYFSPVRWDLRVETYESKADLVAEFRRFAGGIMHRERRGDLGRLE